MNALLKCQGIDPASEFRHPTLGLNRFPEDGTAADWETVTWLAGNAGTKPTFAELLAAPYPAAYAREAAIASIYDPVEYNGKFYPADGASLFKYEAAKQSRGRGRLAKAVAIAVDGTPLKLSTAAEIDDFHAAIETAVTARIEAVHDAL